MPATFADFKPKLPMLFFLSLMITKEEIESQQ